MKGITRSIAGLIILSILTCGIYHLYWMYVTTNEINEYLSQEDTSGGMVLVFSFITCGIYTIYWYYSMGKKIQAVQCKTLGIGNDDSLLYLLLCVFGLSIVSSAIIQSNLNNAWGSL